MTRADGSWFARSRTGNSTGYAELGPQVFVPLLTLLCGEVDERSSSFASGIKRLLGKQRDVRTVAAHLYRVLDHSGLSYSSEEEETYQSH